MVEQGSKPGRHQEMRWLRNRQTMMNTVGDRQAENGEVTSARGALFSNVPKVGVIDPENMLSALS